MTRRVIRRPFPGRTGGLGLLVWEALAGPKDGKRERFSRGLLTAAHRTVPLGTKVKVTHLRTKPHMVVNINDRSTLAMVPATREQDHGRQMRASWQGQRRLSHIVISTAPPDVTECPDGACPLLHGQQRSIAIGSTLNGMEIARTLPQR
jgi:hypothetical protein